MKDEAIGESVTVIENGVYWHHCRTVMFEDARGVAYGLPLGKPASRSVAMGLAKLDQRRVRVIVEDHAALDAYVAAVREAGGVMTAEEYTKQLAAAHVPCPPMSKEPWGPAAAHPAPAASVDFTALLDVLLLAAHRGPQRAQDNALDAVLAAFAAERERAEEARATKDMHKERAERAEAEVARLKAQLPDDMKHCTILFKECEKGHGRLTATNWIDHGCGICQAVTLVDDLNTARHERNALVAQVEAVRALLPGHVGYWQKDGEGTFQTCAYVEVADLRAALAKPAGDGTPPPASDEGREAFQLTLDDYVRTFAAAAMNRSKSMNNTERERVEDNRDILRDRVLALYDRAIVTAALRGKS